MMNYRIYTTCLLSLFLVSCAHKGVELPEIVQIQKVNPYHKVSDGDTVGSVAEKYGMTRAELIKLNNLEPPYQLYDGQKLVITVKAEPTQASVPENSEASTSEEVGNNETAINPEDIPTEKDVETIDDIAPVKTEYIWPIENGKSKIAQHFNSAEVDGGIIIDASVGTPVKSIADGVVVIAGVPSGEAAAYGVTVVVKHTEKKMMSIYANLKEADVSVGNKIKQGQRLGKVGQSGSIAQKPQLYFELNDLTGPGRKAVDPEKFLSK